MPALASASLGATRSFAASERGAIGLSFEQTGDASGERSRSGTGKISKSASRMPRPMPRRLKGSPAAAQLMCASRRTATAAIRSGRQRFATTHISVMQDLAEEQLGAFGLRVVEEALRIVLLDDLAAVHEDHAVRHRAGEAHFMG